MNLIKKLQKIYTNTLVQQGIGISIIVFFTISYILLMLNKYWQFEYFAIDNVYFDTAMWKLAHFQAPIVTHPILGQINIFGDHFHPVIFLMSILYMFTSHQEVIFIMMALLYGASAFLAMQIGFKLIKSKIVTYGLLIAYFLYLGTEQAMIYGFHELNFVPFFFFLTVYMIVFNRWKLFWVSLLLLLLTKESMPFVTIPLAFFIFFAVPKRKKEAVATVVVSIIYYFVVTKLIIPHFGHTFLYSQVDLPNDIPDFIDHLIHPTEKIETFVVSMLTFGLLPLLNVFTLPLVLQDFLIRYIFTIPGNVQYTLFFHYNIALAPLLLFSSIWSVKTLQESKLVGKYKKFLWIMGVLVFSISFYYLRFYGKRGPLLETYNKAFYQTTKNNSFLWELVHNTPKDGTVMTQNHLGYIYAHQGSALFPDRLGYINQVNEKYIVVDFRDGQNPNNFFPLGEENTKKMVQMLLDKGSYRIYYQKGSMMILVKK